MRLSDRVADRARVLIVDEGYLSGGFTQILAGRIAAESFFDLDAPVRRVCSVEVPIPYARHLELAALPSVERIVAAAEEAVGHG